MIRDLELGLGIAIGIRNWDWDWGLGIEDGVIPFVHYSIYSYEKSMYKSLVVNS